MAGRLRMYANNMRYKLRVQTQLTITPDEHPSIHATNIIRIHNNQYLLAWFGGTRERHPDTAIWGSIYDGIINSSFIIAKIDPSIPHWNPILMQFNNRIICYFKVGYDCTNWRTWVTSSEDGRLWARPQLLVYGDCTGRGPSKNKPIILSNGVWLAPGSSELDGWHTYIDRSNDGETWQISDPITFRDTSQTRANGMIQPAIWESDPGHVHVLMRSTYGYLWRSDSIDYGKTWCKPYITDIPNNNSGIDIVKVADNIIGMVYNPVAQNWGARTPLAFALSYNNGRTWVGGLDLEDGPSEYSYPSIIASEGEIAITYTKHRRSIGLVLGNLGRV